MAAPAVLWITAGFAASYRFVSDAGTQTWLCSSIQVCSWRRHPKDSAIVMGDVSCLRVAKSHWAQASWQETDVLRGELLLAWGVFIFKFILGYEYIAFVNKLSFPTQPILPYHLLRLKNHLFILSGNFTSQGLDHISNLLDLGEMMGRLPPWHPSKSVFYYLHSTKCWLPIEQPKYCTIRSFLLNSRNSKKWPSIVLMLLCWPP